MPSFSCPWASPPSQLVLAVHKSGHVIDTLDIGADASPTKRWYVVGRDSAQADLVFEHSTISRRHAAIAHGAPPGSHGGGGARQESRDSSG